jgi:hypothetical protein
LWSIVMTFMVGLGLLSDTEPPSAVLAVLAAFGHLQF